MDLLQIYLKKYDIKESPDLSLKKTIHSFLNEKGIGLSMDAITVRDGLVSIRAVGPARSAMFMIQQELEEVIDKKLRGEGK